MNPYSYDLHQEYPPEGEELLIEQLIAASRQAMERHHERPMRRALHPKSHGLLAAELIVSDEVPEELRAGVFASPGRYEAYVRFSNGSNERDADENLLPDSVGDVRGMAVKLPGFRGGCDQDFVLINHPVMFLRDVEGYLHLLPILEAMRKGLIGFAPGRPPEVPEELQAHFQAIAYALPILGRIRAKTVRNPLEIRYWSATPYLLGELATKFSLAPLLEGEPSPAGTGPHALRESMVASQRERPAVFDFLVQVQSHAVEMPVEDPTVEWDETLSPFVKVATLLITPQEFDTEERRALDESMAFSPWHCLPEHRPLGGLNRARRRIYEELAGFRLQINSGAAPQ